MPLRDRLLALLVAVVWGVNFPATAIALEHFPPLFMVALRFTLIAIPTLLLVPRPQVPRALAARDRARHRGDPVRLPLSRDGRRDAGGLASLVLQASAPFTVPDRRDLVARAAQPATGWSGSASPSPDWPSSPFIAAQIAAALPVVLDPLRRARLGVRQRLQPPGPSPEAAAPDPVDVGRAADPDPDPLAAVRRPGPRLSQALSTSRHRRGVAVGAWAALHRGAGHTLLGYGLWNSLLSRHPSSVVAPFSMMVPVAGVLSSWLFFDEIPDVVELAAGVAVIARRAVLRLGRP